MVTVRREAGQRSESGVGSNDLDRVRRREAVTLTARF